MKSALHSPTFKRRLLWACHRSFFRYWVVPDWPFRPYHVNTPWWWEFTACGFFKNKNERSRWELKAHVFLSNILGMFWNTDHRPEMDCDFMQISPVFKISTSNIACPYFEFRTNLHNFWKIDGGSMLFACLFDSFFQIFVPVDITLALSIKTLLVFDFSLCSFLSF